MLSERSRPIVAATLPVINERIEPISHDFYRRMFSAHPELLDGTFSRANQRSGEQPKALSGSIAAFAAQLIAEPGSLPERLLTHVAHKHASLGVLPEQYEIVYSYLFQAIAADLGDAATPAVVDAWTEVYWLMADALIALERDLYAHSGSVDPWATWTVADKQAAGSGAMRIRLERPAGAPAGRPGQYVSVRVRLQDGRREVRQYSLSDAAESTTTRIVTVKREEDGAVSTALHDDVRVGDTIEVSAPFGEIVLVDDDSPVVLISAGIGCTPHAAMLRTLATTASNRPIQVAHSEHDEDGWALREQMRGDARSLGAPLHECFTGSGGDHLTLDALTLTADAHVYVCGPIGFMRTMREQAIERGVPAHHVHHEVFGPDTWLARE